LHPNVASTGTNAKCRYVRYSAAFGRSAEVARTLHDRRDFAQLTRRPPVCHCLVSLRGLSIHTNGSIGLAVKCETLSCSCAASSCASSRLVRPVSRLSHNIHPPVRGSMVIALGPVPSSSTLKTQSVSWMVAIFLFAPFVKSLRAIKLSGQSCPTRCLNRAAS